MVLTRHLLFFIFCTIQFAVFSQSGIPARERNKTELLKSTPVLSFQAPSRSKLFVEDLDREENGLPYRIGVSTETGLTTLNSGNWTTAANGDKIWQLRLKYSGAEALSFLFSNFRLYDKSTFDVFDVTGKKLHETLTSADIEEHFNQHIALCFGDEMVLQLREPFGSGASEIFMDRITYNYRGTGNKKIDKDFNDSESCEINVNCSPVGDNWQDEKRGIARLLCIDGQDAYWCSGSLVNNLAADCKPYMLTAQHCGVGVTQTDLDQWIFYFAYEASGCTDPSSETSINTTAKRITGATLLAKSDGVTGENTITSSDFILLRIGAAANEASVVTKLKTAAINAYWNGWDANNTAATGGAGIHHPAGDIKKISTYTGTLLSTNYSAGASNTHWQVTWTANANGHGVTEGGSSGSPLFNTNGGNSRIVGTLSGGTSYCDALTSPDLYGKFSYHWASNGTATNKQLKAWLDPNSTGLLVCNGSSNPCAVTGTAPVANFIATPVTVNPGGIVAFTDQSTNAPASWAWTITPATGWAYTNSSASSQNPQVIFNTQGSYTVSLTATNSAGSDTETKLNYITVTIVSQPCSASVVNCDEYISLVTLNTINNSSDCLKYTSYATPQTNLIQGHQYSLTVVPSIDGAAGAYTGDEIAAWIDWNHDYDFADAGERIAYVIVADNWSNQFTFNVPLNASTGALTMRVRISYEPQEGAIDPCGETAYGEVEDYIVNILPASLSVDENILSGVKIYPNPGNNEVTVDASFGGNSILAELTDLTGKVILSGEVLSKTSFDISQLSKGSYLFKLSSGDKTAVKAFIKL